MRIIGGKHRGRSFASVEGKTVRPTSSMVREAVFNIITHLDMDDERTHLLDGAIVADICCGSGALGLEALSRGAAKVVFVDAQSTVLKQARANAEKLGELENSKFFQCDATKLPRAIATYEVVFIDPPYSQDLSPIILQLLLNGGWLRENGIIVLEQAKKDAIPEIDGLEIIKDKVYGRTRVLSF